MTAEEEPTPESAEPGPAGRRYPSTVGGALYLVVLLVAAVALFVVGAGDWRIGVRILAVALGGAAVARLLLPRQDAGMLAVRNRFVDVTLLVVVAVALFVLAGSIPDQPG